MRAFETFNEQIEEELKRGETIAQEALREARTAEGRTEFESIDAQLKKIEGEHRTYSEHVTSIIAVIREGSIGEALESAEEVEKEEDELNREIGAFLTSVEKFTEESALQAEDDEQIALVGMIVATVAGVLLSLLMGLLVSRSITSPVAKMVGVVQGLGRGRLTSRLEWTVGTKSV